MLSSSLCPVCGCRFPLNSRGQLAPHTFPVDDLWIAAHTEDAFPLCPGSGYFAVDSPERIDPSRRSCLSWKANRAVVIDQLFYYGWNAKQARCPVCLWPTSIYNGFFKRHEYTPGSFPVPCWPDDCPGSRRPITPLDDVRTALEWHFDKPLAWGLFAAYVDGSWSFVTEDGLLVKPSPAQVEQVRLLTR